MRIITVDLPYPVSTNRLWRYGKGNVYNSPEYKAWKKDADTHAMIQLRNVKMITRPFEAHIWLNTEGGRIDVDNVKCLMDWAQSRELIHNDNLCSRFIVERVMSEPGLDFACRLMLTELT